ncbi:MAG: heme exporter protein CcmB [Saprospiraceae bacterium]|nr:heme exporter protein CcmB [Saprospiraceae bacterium]
MKNDFEKIWALISVDLKTEYRNRYDSYGLYLFVMVVSYILYKGTESMDAFSYNSIFWVLILVLSTNFALRAFTKTKEEESYFLYHLVSSYHIIFAKLLYNWIVIFIGGVIFLLSSIIFHSSLESFMTFPIVQFIILLLVSSLCLSSTFSLPSALVLTSNNKETLLGILSFPISIPITLVCINLGGELISKQTWNMSGLLLLLSVVLIMSTVSLFLFKYNWQL